MRLPGAAEAPWIGSCEDGEIGYAITNLFLPDDERAVLGFWNSDETDPAVQRAQVRTLATSEDVGSVFGLAYDAASHALFASAYHRAHRSRSPSRLGPGGLGGIYRIDLQTGSAKLWAELDAGDLADASVPPADLVGRIGIGDIDIDPEGELLYAVNLYDKHIYALDLTTREVVHRFLYGLPASMDAWPFGLALRDGRVFHGVAGAIGAAVYKSRADGSQMELVTAGQDPEWRAWGAWDDGIQPMLADIEVGRRGDLVLGVRDRRVDRDLHLGRAAGSALWARRWSNAEGQDRWNEARPLVVRAQDLPHELLPTTGDLSKTFFGGLAATGPQDAVVAASTFGGASGGVVWFDLADREPLEGTAASEILFGEEIQGGDIESLCRSERVFLPSVLQRDCLENRKRSDLMIVMDASSSMREGLPSGVTKMEAAVAAVLRLLEPLERELFYDRAVSLVGFHNRAWVEVDASPATAATAIGLQRIAQGTDEGTRLDLALVEAAAHLDDPRDLEDRDDLVLLLTDGLPTGVPAGDDGTARSTILAAARDLAEHATILAVGFGAPGDIDRALLEEIASEGGYRDARDAAELESVLAALGDEIACPGRP